MISQWGITIDERIPLGKQATNRFAWRLRSYLEERIAGLEVERVAFLLYEGEDTIKVHVKKERRKAKSDKDEDTIVDVFEDIGGPEIRLYVNEFRIATWMVGADRLTTDMLDKNFEEFAHVAMLAILGTWELHNKTICCKKWGDAKGKRIECCGTE